MKLMHEFDEKQISALAEALRVKYEHFQKLIHAGPSEADTDVLRYAEAILVARSALGMSNGYDAVIDPPKIEPVEACQS